MRIIMIATGLAAVTLGGPSAQAEIRYPWCFQEVSEAGYVSCAYGTFDQCMASRHGQSGFCVRNDMVGENASRRPDAAPKGRKPR